MSVYEVNIKFGKDTMKGVNLDTNEEPMVFKAQIYELTGVLPERQKLFIKGVALKEDSSWSNFKLANGMTILLMGSKEPVPSKPEKEVMFVEDMDEHQLATAYNLPTGLVNLGNTCYMNATVQCLRCIPELCEALQHYGTGRSTDLNDLVVAALKDVYHHMSVNGPTYSPATMVSALHMALPRFAEKTDVGVFMQQDANECWTEIVRMLQVKLHALKPDSASNSKQRMFIDQFLGGTFIEELKCTESEDEPASVSYENFLQLNCFISQDVKYMLNGIKSKMQETVVKHSNVLGRDAKFTKTSKISRLPAYLTIQFVRFFYKEKESINAKILKEIKFPLDFDAYELCSPELQAKLTPMRQKFKEHEDKMVGIEINVGSGNNGKDTKEMKKEPYWFPDDYGSNNSGYYTLQAVLTHRGRSSSSGHYVAWIKQDQRWIMCDDDKISVVPSEDILKLSGGGDWHCAYVLLYGPKVLEVPATQE